MSEDLQSLLEKINRDGVEKAQAESAKIINDAKVRAAAIVEAAKAEAEKARAEADKAAADYAARAQVTVKQAARDVLLGIEDAVTKMLEKLLAADVDAALADPKADAELALAAIRDLAAGAEIAAPAKLAAALKAQLAAKPGLQVITDESLGSGFSVRLDGGRVEHSFTGATVAGELAKRLRPDLAKLVK